MITYPNIDPVAIHIGPLAIRWYGLSYIVGIGLGWWLLSRKAQQEPGQWSSEQISDLVFYAALGAVLGGRIGYVLFYNLALFLEEPLVLFKVWQGGMSFHGGLIGAVVGVWMFARRERRSFLSVADFLVPVVPVGLFAGRIANFINGELWGAPTDVPWGVVFPNPLAGNLPRHPSQLYEAALEGIVLFIVLQWFSRRERPTGRVSGLFLFLYGVFRFLVEFVRTPDIQLGYLAFNWVTMGQILCIPMLLIGGWLLMRKSQATA